MILAQDRAHRVWEALPPRAKATLRRIDVDRLRYLPVSVKMALAPLRAPPANLLDKATIASSSSAASGNAAASTAAKKRRATLQSRRAAARRKLFNRTSF